MATFTTIPDTDLDADSPITENLMLALRDNPLAIASGDAAAPKIQDEAFTEPPSPPLTAGNNIIFRSSTEKQVIHNSYAVVKIISSPGSGTIRTRFQALTGIAEAAAAKIYINGVAAGTARSLTNTFLEFTQDFTVSKGDNIEVWTVSTNDNPTTVGLFSIECSIKKFGGVILD
jgi:hypothetical protein